MPKKNSRNQFKRFLQYLNPFRSTGKKPQQVQQVQPEAVEVQKAAQEEKAVVQPAAKAAEAPKAEDINTGSKPAEKQSRSKSMLETIGEETAEKYMKHLAEVSQKLQEYMDVLAETNSASKWKKSSAGYKEMYNALRSMKGDENSFFDALRKETPLRVHEKIVNLEAARKEYMKDADRWLKKDSLTEKPRMAVADDMRKYTESMGDHCMGAIDWCKRINMPEYIDQHIEAVHVKAAKQPVKLTAKELADKVEGHSHDTKIRETEVGTWTSLELVQGKQKSGEVKKESKKKAL